MGLYIHDCTSRSNYEALSEEGYWRSEKDVVSVSHLSQKVWLASHSLRKRRRRHQADFQSLSKFSLHIEETSCNTSGQLCHVICKKEVSWPNYHNPSTPSP